MLCNVRYFYLFICSTNTQSTVHYKTYNFKNYKKVEYLLLNIAVIIAHSVKVTKNQIIWPILTYQNMNIW